MADLFVQRRRGDNSTGSGKFLKYDDYHVEGSIRWGSAPMKSTGRKFLIENYLSFIYKN